MTQADSRNVAEIGAGPEGRAIIEEKKGATVPPPSN
jgi:hypothetical protein